MFAAKSKSQISKLDNIQKFMFLQVSVNYECVKRIHINILLDSFC